MRWNRTKQSKIVRRNEQIDGDGTKRNRENVRNETESREREEYTVNE